MKKTVKDFDLKNKTVILRCDFNVSIKDNEIIDDTRIKESLKTIKYLQEQQSKIVLISHLGKVKSVKDTKKYSMKIVEKRLNEYLENQVEFEESLEFSQIKKHLQELQPNKILLLENTRFYDLKGNLESNCDLELAKNYSSLGNIFINDAFGTIHRKHASNYGISKYLPSGIGFLVEKELENLNKLNNPQKPYIIIMGGAKISDKLEIINSLINQPDKILIGGAMANTFLKALNIPIGRSIYEPELLNYCQELIKNNKNKIILPVDFIGLTNKNQIAIRTKDNIEEDFNILDIGPSTINNWQKELKNAITIFWNGPLGKYEDNNFKQGTKAILKYISQNIPITILGGGDIVSAATTLGYKDKITFCSTGGGATLSYLTNPNQPGLENIEEVENE